MYSHSSFADQTSLDGQRRSTDQGQQDTATQNVATRVGVQIAGEHLIKAIAEPRILETVSRHIQRTTQDVVLPPELELPASTAGLQRDGASRARQLGEFAKYTTTIIKLCQLDISEEELRSKVETIAVSQLAALQAARTDIAFADCLPPAQRRLVQQLRSADLFTDEDRRLIGISGEVLYAGAQSQGTQHRGEPFHRGSHARRGGRSYRGARQSSRGRGQFTGSDTY